MIFSHDVVLRSASYRIKNPGHGVWAGTPMMPMADGQVELTPEEVIPPPEQLDYVSGDTPSTPTADMVKRYGYRDGAKLVIKIVPLTGKELSINNLSLQSIAEPDSERYQIHEAFDDHIIYLFGRRPRVWTIQGIVANNDDHDFANELERQWEDEYRGTKIVEKQASVFMAYDNVLIEATLLDLTVVRNATMPSLANVTITFIVHQRNFAGGGESNTVLGSIKKARANRVKSSSSSSSSSTGIYKNRPKTAEEISNDSEEVESELASYPQSSNSTAIDPATVVDGNDADDPGQLSMPDGPTSSQEHHDAEERKEKYDEELLRYSNVSISQETSPEFVTSDGVYDLETKIEEDILLSNPSIAAVTVTMVDNEKYILETTTRLDNGEYVTTRTLRHV